MNIQKYVQERHEEHIPEGERAFFTEPSDISRYEEATREAVADAESLIDIPEDLDIVVSETDREVVRERYGEDPLPVAYVHGFSFCEGWHGVDAVFMRVLDSFDEWRDAFKNMLVHELAHQHFYEKRQNWESFDDQYHSILFEGYAEIIADEVGREENYDYSPVWREKDLDVDLEELKEDLEHPRSLEGDKDHDMFRSGGSRWSKAEGYTIAYQVFRKLGEQGEDFEEVINWSPEKLRKTVDEITEEIYA